ncbi:hypothetical protein HY483_01065 [Candidatus Woesearchaeota archaeon]|nr:hypothetical protein [Candidatus Woesearchaeota archaeon]
MVKKWLRIALLVLVLSLFVWLSVGAVPQPPAQPSEQPADSLLDDAGSTASTDSTNSQIIDGGMGAGGGFSNATRSRANSSNQSDQANAQDQNVQAGSTDQTNDTSQAPDENSGVENQQPVEEKPGNNNSMIIVLSLTSILIIVAIILVLNNLRKHKTPQLPQQSAYGFQANGIRQPIGASMVTQTAQSSQPRIMQQRQVQPQTIIRTQRLATPVISQQNQQTVQRQQLDVKILPLIDYLTNTFSQGYKIQDVQSYLKGSGWTDDDIKKALNMINSKRQDQ